MLFFKDPKDVTASPLLPWLPNFLSILSAFPWSCFQAWQCSSSSRGGTLIRLILFNNNHFNSITASRLIILLSRSQLEGSFTHSSRKARGEQWMPCSLCLFPSAQGFPQNLRATFCPYPYSSRVAECSDQIWLFTWVQGIKTHVFKGASSLLSIEYAVLTPLGRHWLLVLKCILFLFIDKLIWVRTSRCKREFYALCTFLHFHFKMYSLIRAYTCHSTCVEVWGPPVGVSSPHLPCGFQLSTWDCQD